MKRKHIVVSLIGIALIAFAVATIKPIIQGEKLTKPSLYYTAPAPERSYCEEAKEAMAAISKYPLTNGYKYKPYVVHFSKTIEDTNYSGPNYNYVIKSKKSGKLIVSMIDMESVAFTTEKQESFIKCNIDLPKEIFTWFGRHSNNNMHLSVGQCLIYKTKDIKGDYPIYLEVDKCLVTKYKGDFENNELKKKGNGYE